MDYMFCQMQQEFTWEGREGMKFTYTEADTWVLQKPFTTPRESISIISLFRAIEFTSSFYL